MTAPVDRAGLFTLILESCQHPYLSQRASAGSIEFDTTSNRRVPPINIPDDANKWPKLHGPFFFPLGLIFILVFAAGRFLFAVNKSLQL